MKVRRYTEYSMRNLSLQLLDYFCWWNRVQKHCGSIIKERNTVDPLKIKVLICVGFIKNGFLVLLCDCPTLRHGNFICMCPFLMI